MSESTRGGQRLTITLRGVGGQFLPLTVRQLVTHLSKHTPTIRVQETFGMSQRGGSVVARVEVEFPASYAVRAPSLLLGLEYLEGLRGLPKLRPGDAAFIASCRLVPPGTFNGSGQLPHYAGLDAPSADALKQIGADLGLEVALVEATLKDSSAVVRAAIEGGFIPRAAA